MKIYLTNFWVEKTKHQFVSQFLFHASKIGFIILLIFIFDVKTNFKYLLMFALHYIFVITIIYRALREINTSNPFATSQIATLKKKLTLVYKILCDFFIQQPEIIDCRNLLTIKLTLIYKKNSNQTVFNRVKLYLKLFFFF